MTELEKIYEKYAFLRKLDSRDLVELLANILVFLISAPKSAESMEDSLIGAIRKVMAILDKK